MAQKSTGKRFARARPRPTAIEVHTTNCSRQKSARLRLHCDRFSLLCPEACSGAANPDRNVQPGNLRAKFQLVILYRRFIPYTRLFSGLRCKLKLYLPY